MKTYDMRMDMAVRGKSGISFILASVVIWGAITVVWLLPGLNLQSRNFFTFCCAAPLMPVAYAISRVVGAEFSVKGNQLNDLGILFSLNQLLYLLIAIWAFAGAPEKMVTIIAVIFGAHLLPFSWLYKSRAYLVMSLAIPVLTTVVGWSLSVDRLFVIPLGMAFMEIMFSAWLFVENRQRHLTGSPSRIS